MPRLVSVTVAPYGSWKSPITSDLIVAKSIGLSEIRLDGDDIYWLESRPEEGGRNVVVRRSSAKDLNPKPFNVRTRVHEYGGGAWTVADGTLYFSNFGDGRLYRLDPGAATPVPLTPEGPWRFADGIIDPRRKLWIGVREDHSVSGQEPVNSIVAVDTAVENRRGLALQRASFGVGSRFLFLAAIVAGWRVGLGIWLGIIPRMPWVGTTPYAVRLNDGSPPIEIAGRGERIDLSTRMGARGRRTVLYFRPHGLGVESVSPPPRVATMRAAGADGRRVWPAAVGIRNVQLTRARVPGVWCAPIPQRVWAASRCSMCAPGSSHLSTCRTPISLRCAPRATGWFFEPVRPPPPRVSCSSI